MYRPLYALLPLEIHGRLRTVASFDIAMDQVISVKVLNARDHVDQNSEVLTKCYGFVLIS